MNQPIPSISAFVLPFALCILIGRCYLLFMLGNDPDFSAVQKFFYLSQDAILILLYLLLIWFMSPIRLWIHRLSIIPLYFNLLMVFAASEAKLYLTLEELKPSNWTGAGTLAKDYASIDRVVILLSSLLIYLYGPKVLRSFFSMILRWFSKHQSFEKTAVLIKKSMVLCLFIYGLGILFFLSPPFKVLHPQTQPLYDLFDQMFFKDALFSDQVEPKSLDEIATELQKIERRPAIDSLMNLRQALPDGANVVLVVLESTGFARFQKVLSENPSFLGNQPKITFEAHQTTVPHSASSLHAIFCGRPRIPKESFDEYLRACRSLPAFLKSQNIQTALFQSSYFGDWIPKSFFENFGFHEIHDSQSMIQLAKQRNEEAAISDQYVQEWQTVKEVLHWSKQKCNQNQKFFTAYYSWVALAPYPLKHLSPHRYAQLPQGIKDEKIPPVQRYEQLLLTLDDQMRDLWEGIKALPCQNETILVITGDHGEAFDDHPGNLYHSAYPYQENLHIPLMILSKQIENDPKLAMQIYEPTSHMDLNATIAHLSTGKTSVLQSDFSRDLMEKIMPRPIFALSMMNRGMVAMHWGNLKMIRNQTQTMIFDQYADPLEKSDLSRSMQKQANLMKQMSHHWMKYLKQEIAKRPQMSFQQQ